VSRAETCELTSFRLKAQNPCHTRLFLWNLHSSAC
jgi:hypothetical protein